LSDRLSEIRGGFQPAFWVANFTELFERLAYYGLQAVLAIYLHEKLGFTDAQTGSIQGIFGFVVWFLPIIAGALADRFGFRRALSFAYLILSLGYFLIGQIGADWMAPVRSAVPLFWVVLAVLMVPALGPGLVKPVVAGTTARASSEAMRGVGYSIYYTIVNVGGALGPLLASKVRVSLGVESVFIMSALFSAAMFVVSVLFFREPARLPDEQVRTVGAALGNVVAMLKNLRLMLFLLLFSGFYIAFWQIYVALPLYVRSSVSPDIPIDGLLAVEGTAVIAFTVLIAWLTKKVPPIVAMATGVLIMGLSFLLLTISGSTPFIVATLIGVAIGEVTQAPRYYEYISRMAPKGQEGVYLGYAFLPIAIGYLIGGPLGGKLVAHYAAAGNPPGVWYVVAGIGVVTAVSLFIYDRFLGPRTRGEPAAA
jgi:dipeptide/tripeptide permease